MTDAGGGQNGRIVTEVVVGRLKRVRRRRGLTVAQLAERCAALGSAETTANVLANIEAGRRQVNVNQFALLALALDVASVHLLAGPDGRRVQVTATARESAQAWGVWLLARAPLPEGGENAFWAYCLENADTDEVGRALIELARQRTTTTTHKIVTELQEQSKTRLAQLRSLADRGLDAIEEAVASGDGAEILAAVTLARRLVATSARSRRRSRSRGREPARRQALGLGALLASHAADALDAPATGEIPTRPVAGPRHDTVECRTI